MSEEKDFGDMFDDYVSTMRFEGERGVENLEKVCTTLGYPETGYRYGSPIESFLADNPGCIEAMLEWISEWIEKSPEWQAAIEAVTEDDDQEEYEDD